MISVSLIILAVLSYLGSNIGMLASVLFMAIALRLYRARPWWVQLGALVVASLLAMYGGEVIHVLYHKWAAARGIRDPLHGGFWMSALLVGLINVAAMVPAVVGTAWWRKRRAGA